MPLSHTRIAAPEVPHAPYAQPWWKAGGAGTPPMLDPSCAGVTVGAPPSSGTLTRESAVARSTEDEAGPAICRDAPGAIPSPLSARVRPEGSTSVLVVAS